MESIIDTQSQEALSGEELKIFTYPAPVLKKVAKEVTEFGPELERLCQNMLFTMYKAPGIGLAAPQVGESLRIFVMDLDFKREEVTLPDGSAKIEYSQLNPMIFINPVIKNPQGEQLYEEGCLSVPGIYEEVKRAQSIVVEYQDVNGNLHKLEASDLLSVCIQHENDHLEGIVFLERLSSLKRQFLTKKFVKAQKR